MLNGFFFIAGKESIKKGLAYREFDKPDLLYELKYLNLILLS